ncbi:hypothetical protein [Methylomonas koyamae]|uniref:hypothetical protein n=1 Tax=Methylomonas koyamae TaxID=702114 RepID=UPI0018E0BB69|nr:hypothetical protein [Methylomonas koyamae]
MKVLVTINPSTNPELYADIERINSRDRAERVRTLATMAVVISQLGLQNSSAVAYISASDLASESTLSKLKSSLATED